MSRTDLDPTTLAASLRRMAGDGSVEWVTEPMQTRVLLDVADMLAENAKLREEFNKMDVWHSKELTAAMDENAKLRELASGLYKCWLNEGCEGCPMQDDDGWCVRDIRLRELGVEGTE